MRVAAVQFDIVWEDKPANHRIIETMLAEANVQAGTYVLLPELGDTGFSFNLDRIVDDHTLSWARDLARTRGVWLQVGYARRGRDDQGADCAALLTPDGDVCGTYEKHHPFSYGREIEHFSGGDSLLICDAGAQVCPMICYDLRFPELWRLAVRPPDGGAAAEVFMIGASWPAARQDHWRSLLRARAIENQAFVVAVNRVGNDPHLAYAGGSLIIDPQGVVLAEADHTPAVLTAELPIDDARTWRQAFPALEDVQAELLGRVPIVRAKPTLTAPS